MSQYKNMPPVPPPTLAANGLQAAALLLLAVDCGFAAVLLVAPWFMGGRHPVGEFVYVALCVQIGVCWLLRQMVIASRGPAAAKGPSTGWRWTGAEPVLIAALALLVIQLVHLPGGLLTQLAPQTSKILPLWDGSSPIAGTLGTWDQVTLAPDATRGALTMLVGYCLLFIVLVQRINDLGDVERIFKCIAAAAVLLASVGLLQCFVGNGKFLWCYEHPFRDTYGVVKGPFINQNHFAHMLALGIGPLIWCLQRAIARKSNAALPAAHTSGLRQYLAERQVFIWSLGLGLVLFAGLMTLSRGGLAGMALASVLTCAAFYRSSMLSRRLVLSMVATFALITVALTIHGYTRVTERLADYTSGSLEKLDAGAGRRRIWEADLNATRDFVRCGSGVGSHREIYPMYLQGSWDTEWTHAENGYLQVALEAGAPGLLLLAAGILLMIRWCLGGMRSGNSMRMFLGAATASGGLVVSLVHSCVDFVWYIPACMSVTVVLAACAVRIYQLRNAQPNGRPQRASSLGTLGCALACVLLIGGWAVQNRFCAAMASPGWDTYLRFALTPDAQAGKLMPDDAIFDALADVVRWTPDDARAHVRLAGVCLRRFEHLQKQAPNAMGLNQIRDAAIASQFPSRAALDTWLSVAVGNHRQYLDQALLHVKAGLACGPLQGEAYIYLAELCFLEGARPETKHPLVAQALAVRPYSAKVQLAAGNEAVLAGKLEQAIACWRTAFHTSVEERNQLIELMVAQRVPPEFLVEKFRPDFSALGAMYRAYGRILPVEQLRPLLVRYAAEAGRRGDSAEWPIEVCLELAGVHTALGQAGQAHAYLNRAASAEPNNFDVRTSLARFYFEQRMFVEAEKQLEWCLQRRPNDEMLKEKMAAAIRGRIAAERSAAAPTGAFR